MKLDETIFLIPLFAALEQDGIRYAVMRNAESLPFDLGDGDIDLLIHPDDFKQGVAMIKRVALACGGGVVAETHSLMFCQVELAGCKEGVWWGVCLDIFAEVRYRGFAKLVDDSIFLQCVQTPNKIWTFPDDVGSLLGFLKELLYNGKYTERYASLARRAVETGRHASFPCLQKEILSLLNRILQQGAVSTSEASRIRRGINRQACAQNPLRYLVDRALFVGARLRRVFKPAGRMVAVLGTDGAGKSTLLDAALPLLLKVAHGSVIVHHLKPDLLPPLARLKGRTDRPRGPVKDPHGSKPSGFLGSCMRVSYLMVDYVAGYWIKVFPLLIKVPPTIYVFDRYAYDMLLDGKRLRIALPEWMIKSALLFVPRPDRIICLGGDPDILVERKKELSLEEVKHQVAALHAWADTHPRAFFLSTTEPLEETVDAFMRVLLLNPPQTNVPSLSD